VLDRNAGPVLYKATCAHEAQREGNFNVDDQDTQAASDEMAAMRRHVPRRLLVRADLVSAQ